MKKKRKIAIILDNINRDIDGVCLVAKNLTDKGHSVYIVPYNLMQFELYLNNYDFILFNFLRKYNINLIKEITSSGIPVGISDTEGGVFSDISIMFANWPDQVNSIKNLNYFFWGREIHDYAINNNLINKEKAFITGCPRFDVYADYGKKYKTKIKYLIENYILFNTNFPLISPRFNTNEKEINQLTESGNHNHKLLKLIDIQKEERDAIIDLIKYLIKNTNKNIVIRPHPFEDCKYYEDTFKNMEKVIINKNGTVKNIIENSLIVIQRGCSTGFEARLLGKKSLSPDWEPFKNITLVDEGNIFIKSKEEILNFIEEKTVSENKLDSKTLSHVDKYFYKLDGNSSLRVAQRIDEAIDREKQSKIIKIYKLKIIIKKFINQILGFSNISYLGIYKLESKKWMNSDKYFNMNTIINKFNELGMDIQVIENEKPNFGFKNYTIKIEKQSK